MITISNSLSFFRIPLAFLFIVDSPYLRLFAVVLAMITDSIDGYLARRNQSVSRFGAILDPATDKFFVYFALTILLKEGRLLPWQAALMLSRDMSVAVYAIFMAVTGKWKNLVFRSLRAGKAATALQFIVLTGLVIQVSFSWMTYGAFALMGGLACMELFQPPERAFSAWKPFEK